VIPDGFVLAGGRSRRMGSDKARAPVGAPAVPMAVAVARALGALGGRVALVRRGDDGLPWRWPDGGPIEVVAEAEGPRVHPLIGVETALRAARTPLCAIAPCDVPDLTTDCWRALIAEAPAVAWDGVRVHPLVAVLDASEAERARTLAAAGAPAQALTVGLRRVLLPEAALADRDDPASLGEEPVAALLAGVPVRDREMRARLAAGERERLLARGIVIPGPR
jgi:molybdopterin-guanine dinucleotide biosynthesis protein A